MGENRVELTLYRRFLGDVSQFNPTTNQRKEITMNAKVTLAAVAGVFLLSSAPFALAEEPAAQPAPATAAAAPAPEAAAPAEPRVFGGQVVGAIHITATVESIDYLTREVILKSDTGEQEAITLGDQVKRITDIHQGDTVEVAYAESVAVLVAGVGTTPARDESMSVQRAANDQKPGAVVTKTTRILATIEALDCYRSHGHPQRTASHRDHQRRSGSRELRQGEGRRQCLSRSHAGHRGGGDKARPGRSFCSRQVSRTEDSREE